MPRYQLSLVTAPLWVIASACTTDTLAQAAYLSVAVAIICAGMIDLALDARARRKVRAKISTELKALADELRKDAGAQRNGGGYA